ncbi:hypothetical protein [Mangrovicella endophytica]|uniref:hypothetical protein n=1 Tax=Mangrovicella endophytica TaxID=2066697 RepID=UPI000C9E23B8|nr:hypothetical protein [Mangrovicella endophytica]
MQRFAPAAAFGSVGFAALGLLTIARFDGLIDAGIRQFFTSGPLLPLAVAGVGLASSRNGSRPRMVSVAAVVLGLAGGLFLRDSLLWPFLSRIDVFGRLALLPPAACMLSGVVLLLPGGVSALLEPLAAILVGVVATFEASLNDPFGNPFGLPVGAALAALWLVSFLVAAGAVLPIRALLIGKRIAGSWLLAIGLLLSGLQFLPKQPGLQEPTPMANPEFGPPLEVPFAPTLPRDAPPAYMLPPSPDRSQQY